MELFTGRRERRLIGQPIIAVPTVVLHGNDDGVIGVTTFDLADLPEIVGERPVGDELAEPSARTRIRLGLADGGDGAGVVGPGSCGTADDDAVV